MTSLTLRLFCLLALPLASAMAQERLAVAAAYTKSEHMVPMRDGMKLFTTVYAPVAVALDFTIQLVPNTALVQAAVQAELEDMLRRDSAPGGTILISKINEAISLADGETDHTVTVPAGNVVHLANEIATMGDITWA